MLRGDDGCRVDTESLEPTSAEGLAARLARRNDAYRMRIVQTMILAALVVRPLPVEVGEYARALSIDDGMLEVARRFASGQLALAAVDFDRNGYTKDWSDARTDALHATGLAGAWAASTDDPQLAARCSGLRDLPADTLGRRMWEFNRARGFVFPGLEGSAPPLLAQHEWVHVLARYGSTLESEHALAALAALRLTNSLPTRPQATRRPDQVARRSTPTTTRSRHASPASAPAPSPTPSGETHTNRTSAPWSYAPPAGDNRSSPPAPEAPVRARYHARRNPFVRAADLPYSAPTAALDITTD